MHVRELVKNNNVEKSQRQARSKLRYLKGCLTITSVREKPVDAWNTDGGNNIQITLPRQESGRMQAETTGVTEYMLSLLLIQIIHECFILIQEWAII